MNFEESQLGYNLNHYEPYWNDSNNNTIKSLLEEGYLQSANNLIYDERYKKAIRNYVDEPIVNEYLRGVDFPFTESLDFITDIHLMNEAISKSIPLPKDIYAFRGIDGKWYPPILNLQIGDSLHNLGFTSISLDYYTAEEFAESCCIFMIRLPAGLHCLYVDYEKQNEIILEPGITLTVVDIFDNNNKLNRGDIATSHIYVCEIATPSMKK